MNKLSSDLFAAYYGRAGKDGLLPPEDEVWYWASSKVSLYSSTGVKSHTFANGMGIVKYNSPLSVMPKDFSGTDITNVRWPKSVTRFVIGAFEDCRYLALASLPDNIEYITDSVFVNCNYLAFTSLPNITRIDGHAFSKCNRLALTTIPASCSVIGNYAFEACVSLTAITFLGKPSSMSGKYIFKDCYNLKTINVPWAEGEVYNAPWGATRATINYNYSPT